MSLRRAACEISGLKVSLRFVVALLKCPNCGAPLQGGGLSNQRTCSYCGALLQVPTAAPAPFVQKPPPPAARASYAIWLPSVLVTMTVALVVGLSVRFTGTKNLSPPPAPNAAARVPLADGPGSNAGPPSGIAWNRLEAIDIHATVEQAKVTVKGQFPEAKVNQDKDYQIDLDHPILNQVRYSWGWGCACLESVVFFFKDYPTRMKTEKNFIPCLVRGLGPVTTSAPPFDYDWAAHGNIPRVHLGPQTLSIGVERDTSPESYRSVLRALGTCRN